MKIKNAKLVSGEVLEFGDFNVFVGGNSVGKTTFILELFSRISANDPSKYYWIKELAYHSDDVTRDMILLRPTLQRDSGTQRYYSIATKGIDGNTDTNDKLRFTDVEVAEIDKISDDKKFSDVRYRRPFVSFMSCESRLGIADSVGITGFNTAPTDPINVLYRSPGLLEKISASVLERFGYYFTLLSHVGTNLALGISREKPPVLDSNTPPVKIYEAIEEWKRNKFVPIKEAGHGMRSMIRLLISLLEPVNQVILIDEPEMHLYPRQKRWLGKQLVSLALTQNKQVFVVTHDPMILQGILDANTIRVFRIDRNDTTDAGVIRVCDFNAITDAGAIKNQDQYLQSLFYHRCIIVEGAADRSFYSNLFDDYSDLEDKDLGLVVAGGAGNSKHLAEIVSKIGLNAAFIFDQDILFSQPTLIQNIYSILGGINDPYAPLRVALDATPEIAALSHDEARWKKIKENIGYTDKAGIGSQWKIANEVAFKTTILNFTEKGIFFVPQGSLESWAPTVVEEKKRFPEKAPDIVRSDPALQKCLNEFACGVFKFIGIELKV